MRQLRLDSFEHLIRDERRAYRILKARRIGGKPRHLQCVGCGRDRLYFLAEGRYRCKSCGHTFGPFTRTWLGQSRLALRRWLWLVKLFELEVTAHVAAQQTEVSYPTALRTFTLMRRALLAEQAPELWPLIASEVEADESYFGGRRRGKRAGGRVGRAALGKIPVFGILERRGQVHVTVVPNVQAATLVGETIKLVKRGSLVYTDKYPGYDALTFCGYRHLKVDHGRRFSQGRVHINGLEGFWSYAKGKLQKHHGISPKYFPLYLYEMQFRYNHRQDNLFELLLQLLLKPVPTA